MGAAAFLKDRLAQHLVRRAPLFYRRFRDVVRRAHAMPLAERRALRDELTVRTLAKALGTPYARGMGLGTDYSAWPLLNKTVLARDPAVCLTPALFPSLAASTGGTTGIPIKLRRTLASVVFEQVVLDDLAQRHAGIDLKRARIAVLRGDVIKCPDDMQAPHWRLAQGGSQLVCSSHHLNAATVDGFIAAIRDFDPDMLWVYPSSLDMLVRLGAHALKTRPFRRLKLVLASSEVLDEGVFAEAADRLGVPVIDYYGQGERVCASYAVRPGEHFFLPAYGRVELVHAYDDGPWSLHEIVGTSFWNAAQPLVRFRTGDLARLPQGLGPEAIEAITLGVAPFRGVEGRNSEYILSPEGRSLFVLSQIPRNVPDVAQMQIVQREPSRVEIHVVPREGFCEASRSVLIANARRKIPASIGIDIVLVERVMRTRAGKSPLVMRLFD